MIDLTELMSVIEYADNHQVKNVRYHLNVKAIRTKSSATSLHGWMTLRAKYVGLVTYGAITRKSHPFCVQGMVIITKKRKCKIFVYFDF